MNLIKLPSDVQISLYLIREELKTRKLFNCLRDIGMTDCHLEPDLSLVILKSIDLYDGSDETFYRYSDIIEKRSKKIDSSNDSLLKQALKVYHDLIEEKRKRKKTNLK